MHSHLLEFVLNWYLRTRGSETHACSNLCWQSFKARGAESIPALGSPQPMLLVPCGHDRVGVERIRMSG